MNEKPINPNQLSKTLIIICGGSGTGKTSVKNMLIRDPNIVKIITSTTRKPRIGEEHGKDYYFIAEETFKQELIKGRFLEHVIYDGNYYGLHGKVIDLILGTQQKNGVIVVDIRGMISLKKYCKEKGYGVITFLFKTPNLEKMVENMRKRGTSDKEIIDRLIMEEKQNKYLGNEKFDYVFTIERLEETTQEIKRILLGQE
jgi:guanylate kinase